MFPTASYIPQLPQNTLGQNVQSSAGIGMAPGSMQLNSFGSPIGYNPQGMMYGPEFHAAYGNMGNMANMANMAPWNNHMSLLQKIEMENMKLQVFVCYVV